MPDPRISLEDRPTDQEVLDRLAMQDAVSDSTDTVKPSAADFLADSPEKAPSAADFLDQKPSAASFLDEKPSASSFLDKPPGFEKAVGAGLRSATDILSGAAAPIADALSKAAVPATKSAAAFLEEKLPITPTINRVLSKVTDPVGQALESGAGDFVEEVGRRAADAGYDERVQQAMRSLAVGAGGVTSTLGQIIKDTKLPETRGGGIAAILAMQAQPLLEGAGAALRGAPKVEGKVVFDLMGRRMGAGESALELALETEKPVPLIDQVKRVVDLVKRASDQGVRPQTILTDYEKKILDKFAPMIKSAVEHRVNVGSLIAKEELESFAQSQEMLRSALNPVALDAVSPRLAAMAPGERLAAATELNAAAKAGTVKVLQDEASPNTMVSALQNLSRPSLESERALGIDLHVAVESERAVANQALVEIAAGRPLQRPAFMQAMRAVAMHMEDGTFSPETGMRMLGIPNLATVENRKAAAELFVRMGSELGQGLSQLSRISARMEQLLSKDKEVEAIFNRARELGRVEWDRPAWNAYTAFVDAYKYGDNFRRAAMTSGLGTTIRNVVSQGARSLEQAYQDAISGVIGASRGQIPWGQALDAAMADVASLWRGSFSKSGRAEIYELMQKFPLETAVMVNTPVGEVTAGQKAARILNTLNSYQENFYRRAAFDAYTRQTAKARGVSTAELTAQEISNAVQHSLNMTYAANPMTAQMMGVKYEAMAKDYARRAGKEVAQLTSQEVNNIISEARQLYQGSRYGIRGGAGRAILDLYQAVPPLTALGSPYPKYWINAIGRMWDLSPMGLVGSEAMAAMSHPDPRIANAAIGRFATGLSMIGAGWGMAELGMWGEKWHEMAPAGKYKPGDKVVDLRPYNIEAPMMALGRIMHDVYKDVKAGGDGSWPLLRLTPEDAAQMMLSMKRTDATGIPIMDLAFSRSWNEGGAQGQGIISQYAGSYVPRFIASMRDLVGILSKQERMPRSLSEPGRGVGGVQFPFSTDPADRAGSGMTASLQRWGLDTGNSVYAAIASQIPFLDRTLEVRKSPLREGVEERLHPGLRASGIAVRIKTPVEAEIDRLGIRPKQYYKHTGNPTYDGLVQQTMGHLSAMALEHIRVNPMYSNKPEPVKKEIMSWALQEIQMAASGAAGKLPRPGHGTSRDLLLEYKARNQWDVVRTALTSQAIETDLMQRIDQKLEEIGK